MTGMLIILAAIIVMAVFAFIISYREDNPKHIDISVCPHTETRKTRYFGERTHRNIWILN